MDRRSFLGILGLASAAPLLPKVAAPGTPETDEQRFYRLARNGPVTNQEFHFKHTVNILPGMVVSNCSFSSSADVGFAIHQSSGSAISEFTRCYIQMSGRPNQIALRVMPRASNFAFTSNVIALRDR